MKKNYANMTKARARVFSTPPPDAASRPFSCAVPSDPLRPLALLSPPRLRHVPACAPSRGPGHRGLPVFRSPSRNAAPRPCIFSALRPSLSDTAVPAFRRRLSPAFPRAFSLFPALRTPPRQKQAKFRQ